MILKWDPHFPLPFWKTVSPAQHTILICYRKKTMHGLHPGPLAWEACPLISLVGGAVSTRPTDSFHVKNKYAHETVALVGLPSNLRKPTSHLPGKPKLTKANKIC